MYWLALICILQTNYTPTPTLFIIILVNIVIFNKNKMSGYHQHHVNIINCKDIPLLMTGKMWFWLLQIQAMPPCRSPRSWPHPSLLTGKQRPGPKGWACLFVPTLPFSSPGEDPEQAPPLSGAPTKNRDSTLPLALSNSSMNREDTQKLQKVSEQRERQAEGREPEERTLICISIHAQAHTYMGLGSTVWRGWLVINKYFIKQKRLFYPCNNNSALLAFQLSSCNLILGVDDHNNSDDCMCFLSFFEHHSVVLSS